MLVGQRMRLMRFGDELRSFELSMSLLTAGLRISFHRQRTAQSDRLWSSLTCRRWCQYSLQCGNTDLNAVLMRQRNILRDCLLRRCRVQLRRLIDIVMNQNDLATVYTSNYDEKYDDPHHSLSTQSPQWTPSEASWRMWRKQACLSRHCLSNDSVDRLRRGMGWVVLSVWPQKESVLCIVSVVNRNTQNTTGFLQFFW